MPKWLNMEEGLVAPASGYKYSAMRVDSLVGASEYTIATIAIDSSGSLNHLSKEINDMFKEVVRACKMSSREENLILRVISFTKNVKELIGFVTLSSIDEKDIPVIAPYGRTALFDATADAIGASMKYSADLFEEDFDNNAVVFIITDGQDNESSNRPEDIKKMLDEYKAMELDSLQTILIGMDTKNCGAYLEDYKERAGIDHYKDAGGADAASIAKITGFVSQSIVSSSQSLANGKPADLSMSI